MHILTQYAIYPLFIYCSRVKTLNSSMAASAALNVVRTQESEGYIHTIK